MQFYLVWPLVLLLLSRAVRRRRTACVVVAALALASFVEMAALYDPLADTARVYYGPDTRAGELLMGALAALLTRGRGWSLRLPVRGEAPAREVPGWAYDLAGLGCVAAVAAMMVTLNGYSDVVYRGGIALVSVLSAVLVGVLSRPASLLARLIGLRPLAAAGARGFALYLWHYPLLLVMNPATRTTELPWWGWALELAVIVLAAEASYRVLEKGVGAPVALGQSRMALGVEMVALVAVLAVALFPAPADRPAVQP